MPIYHCVHGCHEAFSSPAPGARLRTPQKKKNDSPHGRAPLDATTAFPTTTRPRNAPNRRTFFRSPASRTTQYSTITRAYSSRCALQQRSKQPASTGLMARGNHKQCRTVRLCGEVHTAIEAWRHAAPLTVTNLRRTRPGRPPRAACKRPNPSSCAPKGGREGDEQRQQNTKISETCVFSCLPRKGHPAAKKELSSEKKTLSSGWSVISTPPRLEIFQFYESHPLLPGRR